jgi:hypothetical protein
MASSIHFIGRMHQNHSCFYDNIYKCLCNNERQVNCHGRIYPKNDAQCYQDHPTCPTKLLCVCPECCYGSRCQFSTLSLDMILVYQVWLNFLTKTISFRMRPSPPPPPHWTYAGDKIFFLSRITLIFSWQRVFLFDFLSEKKAKRAEKPDYCLIVILHETLTKSQTFFQIWGWGVVRKKLSIL